MNNVANVMTRWLFLAAAVVMASTAIFVLTQSWVTAMDASSLTPWRISGPSLDEALRALGEKPEDVYEY